MTDFAIIFFFSKIQVTFSMRLTKSAGPRLLLCENTRN